MTLIDYLAVMKADLVEAQKASELRIAAMKAKLIEAQKASELRIDLSQKASEVRIAASQSSLKSNIKEIVSMNNYKMAAIVSGAVITFIGLFEGIGISLNFPWKTTGQVSPPSP